MTVSELFEYVDEILENSFTDKIKLRWLNQVEAELQVDVLLMAADGIVQYTLADLDAELLAPAPYDQLYHEYLFLQICLAQHEDDLANKYAVTYNRAYNEYVRFVCETIDPGSGKAELLRYYLTAYQIAVKHGYAGSELEWIESLKGPKGDRGDGLTILGVKETPEELPKDAKVGDAYLVGTQAEQYFTLYLYDENGWNDCGPFRGSRLIWVDLVEEEDGTYTTDLSFVYLASQMMRNEIVCAKAPDGIILPAKILDTAAAVPYIAFERLIMDADRLWQYEAILTAFDNPVYQKTEVKISGGAGMSFEVDNKTLVMENGVLRVNTVDDVVQDNTQPITSAAVYATVGNISAILDTI